MTKRRFLPYFSWLRLATKLFFLEKFFSDKISLSLILLDKRNLGYFILFFFKLKAAVKKKIIANKLLPCYNSYLMIIQSIAIIYVQSPTNEKKNRNRHRAICRQSAKHYIYNKLSNPKAAKRTCRKKQRTREAKKKKHDEDEENEANNTNLSREDIRPACCVFICFMVSLLLLLLLLLRGLQLSASDWRRWRSCDSNPERKLVPLAACAPKPKRERERERGFERRFVYW